MRKIELDTPVAVVDLDIMERNISDMAAFARDTGVHLRPHIKTHKVPEITRRQLEAGAVGITCAKLGEAEVMAEAAGAKDIFIANLIVGDDKIRRLLNLAERVRMSVGVDSIEVGQPISDAATRRGLKVPVLIKIDVGLERTGVSYGEPAVELAKKIKEMPGLELSGIYTHEGQVYGATSSEHLYELAQEAGHRITQTAKMIRQAGIEIDTVSVGATPSARVTCAVSGVTETRPGTYVFNDLYQIKLGVAEERDCALTVLATVISVPARDRAVIDAGTKSLFSDKSSAFGVYGLVKGMPHVALVRAYEEHGVLKVDPSEGKLEVGDKLEIIPNHVCPAVNLFDELVGVRNGNVTVTWSVAARGKLR
jgi:D-serine deaminase-like pyridoxal phosphate-dependent protein